MKKITGDLYYAGKQQRFAQYVIAGGLIYLSGSSGRTIETGEVSSDDITEQVVVAYDKIRNALTAAGATMKEIIKVTIYLKDINDYVAVKQAEWDYWTKYAPELTISPPCGTAMQIVSLSKPNMKVEFDVVAVAGDKTPATNG